MKDHEITCVQKTDRTQVHERIKLIGGIDPADGKRWKLSQGEAIMAIGSSLMEELIDDQGKITTTNLGEYKIPNIVDIPRFKTVLVKGKNGPGPYEAKGIGEHANVSPPAAIANAIQDACGVRLFEIPATAERIYEELRKQQANRQ